MTMLGVCLQDNHNSQSLEVHVDQDPRIEELGTRPGRSSQRMAFQPAVLLVRRICRRSRYRDLPLVAMMEVVAYCGAGFRTTSRLG
jgi:hypothetical protein